MLARDRFGIKPLYYRDATATLAFASELKALLPPGSREVDLDALEAFLAFNSIPAPLTILRGRRASFRPATCSSGTRSGEPRVERYARPAPAPADERPLARTSDELAEELRARLRDSVRAHLIADVPVGVLLSGGVDSGALAALAALESARAGADVLDRLRGARRSTSSPTRARWPSATAPTTTSSSSRPTPPSSCPSSPTAFDEPFADSSALPTYLVSRARRASTSRSRSPARAATSSSAATTPTSPTSSRRGSAPLAAAARPLVERLPSSSAKASLDYKAKRFVRAAHLPPLERHHAWKEIFSPDARAALLDPERHGSADPLDVYRARYAETAGAEELARLQDVDLGVYLVDDLLVKTDRASMAHSLEARVPFLDPVVAELALALPTRLKVRGFSKKRLLRKAVAPLLPRAVVYGPQARLLDPGGGVAARRRSSRFAREVLSPTRRSGARASSAPRRCSASSTTTWPAARISRASSGACSTFTLWHEQVGAPSPQPSPREGLGRHHGAGPRAGVPAADRAHARARRRGRGDGA